MMNKEQIFNEVLESIMQACSKEEFCELAEEVKAFDFNQLSAMQDLIDNLQHLIGKDAPVPCGEVRDITDAVFAMSDTDAEVCCAMMEDGYCDYWKAIAIVGTQDYTVYPDCETMADVAAYEADEEDLFCGVDERLKRFFDFEAYGKQLETEAAYYHIKEGMVAIER